MSFGGDLRKLNAHLNRLVEDHRERATTEPGHDLGLRAAIRSLAGQFLIPRVPAIARAAGLPSPLPVKAAYTRFDAGCVDFHMVFIAFPEIIMVISGDRMQLLGPVVMMERLPTQAHRHHMVIIDNADEAALMRLANLWPGDLTGLNFRSTTGFTRAYSSMEAI